MHSLSAPITDMRTLSAPRVTLGGVLGKALAASHVGRLSRFIVDETSPAIALYRPDAVSRNVEGDWYGEHAGKWLYAAAKSVARTGDETLATSVKQVADYLVGLQDADGYLGTYAPKARFMEKQLPGPQTWNGAPGKRTWDIWNHTCLILGLLETYKAFPNPKYLAAAQQIGDLCWQTLSNGDINITELGLHHGMSATVLLDATMDLHAASGDRKYLDLATLILDQANRHPGLALLDQALAGVDAAEISTGKAYQLCWNLVGLAKLHRVTGNKDYLRAVENLWASIRKYHLTLGGGPWGGVGLRSREIFNHQSVFSPHGYVETCSIMSWIQLNRELHAINGEAKYAEEIERAAFNDLLGACAPNGEDWCYYSFPNGKRVFTTYWRCCKSSGAMALEELPSIAYGLNATGELLVNIYGPSRAEMSTFAAGVVTLEQITRYPFDGHIRIIVSPEIPSVFSVLLRIPSWAHEATLQINGVEAKQPLVPETYTVVERHWRPGDEITLQFPMTPVIHWQASRSVQESTGPDRAPIEQEVMRADYLAISRGPLVYATGLIDGFKMSETIRLPAPDRTSVLDLLEAPQGFDGPAIRLRLAERAPLVFHPYYEAGGRTDGTWRLTWMQVTAESAADWQVAKSPAVADDVASVR